MSARIAGEYLRRLAELDDVLNVPRKRLEKMREAIGRPLSIPAGADRAPGRRCTPSARMRVKSRSIGSSGSFSFSCASVAARLDGEEEPRRRAAPPRGEVARSAGGRKLLLISTVLKCRA
jgi:hypothetical protein